ncbi:uncharacterized protein AMSG_04795 [Thecamonas trahens ATCC 50062]|uniref:Uncharacterized protein n=1 Tax=Thecamonas trahens ATCC 50062 TaxID=461836 RepID=A0A0L0D812_THETB|nr:hypothetical protein AMSG_04795 [Thecamonas trahens ATCC 50062]KNC48345.1 hypothetical protein AMSG_04795 [Thecamonas trahens ATCC 50062]|eukprot:XP_013758470.1 hypothetical protein AMSG_04795 [Thecamonas trahens ATCC 50062]
MALRFVSTHMASTDTAAAAGGLIVAAANAGMEELELSHNAMTDDTRAALISALGAGSILLPSLSSLVIVSNVVDQSLLSAVARASPALASIELRHCTAAEGSLTEVMEALANDCPDVEKLVVVDSPIGNAGVRRWLAGPRPRLVHLALGDVGLGPTSVATLLAAELPALATLVLDDNPLGTAAVERLLDAGSRWAPALQRLSLARTRVLPKDVPSLIARAETRRPTTDVTLAPQQKPVSARDAAYFGDGLDEWRQALAFAMTRVHSPSLIDLLASWHAAATSERLDGFYLGYLDLDGHDLQQVVHLAAANVGALPAPAPICGIYLEGVQLGDGRVSELAAALDALPYPLEGVTTLVLKGTSINADDANLLASALPRALPSLEVLDVSNNPELTTSSIVSLFATLATQGISLVVFAAASTALDTSAVAQLVAHAPAMPKLVEIDVRGNGLDADDLDDQVCDAARDAGIGIVFTDDDAPVYRQEPLASPFTAHPPSGITLGDLDVSVAAAPSPLPQSTASTIRIQSSSDTEAASAPQQVAMQATRHNVHTPMAGVQITNKIQIQLDVLLDAVEQLEPPSTKVMELVTSLRASLGATRDMLRKTQREGAALETAVATTHTKLAGVQQEMKRLMAYSATASAVGPDLLAGALPPELDELDTQRFVLRDQLRSLTSSTTQLLSLQADLLSSLLDESSALVQVSAAHARPSQWALLDAAGLGSHAKLTELLAELESLAASMNELAGAEDRAAAAAVTATLAHDKVRKLELELAAAREAAVAADASARSADAAKLALRESVAAAASALNVNTIGTGSRNRINALAARLRTAHTHFADVVHAAESLAESQALAADESTSAAAELARVHTALAKVRGHEAAASEAMEALDAANELARKHRIQLGEVARLESRLALLEGDRDTALHNANLSLYKETELAYNQTSGLLANARFEAASLANSIDSMRVSMR